MISRSLLTICVLAGPRVGFAQSDSPAVPIADEESDSAESRATAMLARLWQRDADGDERISQSEFPGPAAGFERADVDGDGYLTRTEAEQFVRDRSRGRGGDRREAMNQRVQSQGVLVGGQMPDDQVLDLEGNAVELQALWRDKPLVLVTASMTCPIAVDSCPTISELRETQDERVRFAILYVREAHPAEGEAAPIEAESADEVASGFGSHPQPATQADRDRLARYFAAQYSEGIPVYVADIDDELIRALGAGPNSGLLIDTEGRLLSKLGWYNPEAMQTEINAVFDTE